MKKNFFKSFIFFSIIILFFNYVFSEVFDEPKKKIKLNYQKYKVSIIYPVYNSQKYIRRSLMSILNQSLKDIKIICINDGSTDNTGKILEYYAKIDSRIILINKKKTSMRAGSARTEGLNFIEGDYVGWVDADDFISPLTFEYTYKYAKKDDVDLLEFDYSRFGGGGIKKRKRKKRKKKKIHKRCNFQNLNLSDSEVDNIRNVWSKLSNYNWSKLYKTTILINSKISFTNDIVGQDVQFNYKLFPFLNKVKILKGKYYCYLRPRKKPTYRNKFLKESEFYLPIIDVWKKNGFNKKKIWFMEILIDVYNRFLWNNRFKKNHINIFINILSQQKDIFNKQVVMKLNQYYIDELKRILIKYDHFYKKNYYNLIFN